MELLYSANAIPITPSNSLRLAFWNARSDTAYTVQLRYQIQNQDGTISNNVETLIVNAAANNQQFTIKLAYGNLLAVTASTFGTTLENGGLYCSIRLQYGDVDDNTQQLPLIAGYVLSGAPLSYPLNQPTAPNSGLPTTRSVRLVDPAAGAEFTDQQAPTSQSKLISGIFTLTTDATPGNRVVQLTVSDQNGNVFTNLASNTVPPSSNALIQLWNTPIPAAIGPSILFLGIPKHPYLQTIQVTSLTTGIGAGDTYTGVNLYYEQLVKI